MSSQPVRRLLISDPTQDDGPRILGATLSVSLLALVVVVSRLWVRTVIIHNFGWDDALMTLATAINIAGQGVIIAQVHYGGGRHIGDVPPDVYMTGMKLNFVSQPMFLFAICIVKLAIGWSLLRIASTKFYRVLIMSIMGFMAFYTIGCFFTIVLQCTDLRILWNPTVQATCWTQQTLQALSYTNVALNITTDLLFGVLIPAPMLWNLNMNKRTKLSLIGVLSLGMFACAAACVKVGYLVNYGKTGDWLWDSRNITIWTVVETTMGIIGGSLPCLKPVFRRFLGSIYGSGSRKTPTNPTYYGRGSRKSGANWASLGSHTGRKVPDVITDETSSERAFNAAREHAHGYEMDDRINVVGKPTVFIEADQKSGSDSDGVEENGGISPPGAIKKTTTTTMTFYNR